MTHESGGTQHVLVCAGGHGKLGTALGDYVMAFALPRGQK
jgi:quinoprotein glucose dehydrogenase